MNITSLAFILLMLVSSHARAAERELRFLTAMGTRINQVDSRVYAAAVSEKVEAAYSFQDWLELAASLGYTGLYAIPTSLTHTGSLSVKTISSAHLFELLIGPTFRFGMTNIVSIGCKIGPQFGLYTPRHAVVSSSQELALNNSERAFSPALLGVAQGSFERRVGEHWAFGLRGSVERSLYVPSKYLPVTSGSLELVGSYAFFPGS